VSITVSPGTISIWSDLGCPWAHLAVWRLHDARRRLHLEEAVRFDHHVFPLELFNSRPTPFSGLMAEIPVIGALAPRAGWQVWQADLTSWPGNLLLPMEAVHAAKEQSLQASEELDRGLRRAFFGESRSIGMRHVILEVASECELVEVAEMAAAVDAGRARQRIFDDWEVAKTDEVRGSPHIFLPDGTNCQNPGIAYHWEGDFGVGFPVVDADDPAVYDDLIRRAAG
jgi:predicted DsbA family dithiol-disulfide isomerase